MTTISIHAPRTGSDLVERLKIRLNQDFNPRSPHGERRHQNAIPSVTGEISIHAPRTGSDAPPGRRWRSSANFNPRSPHGERRRSGEPAGVYPAFQSTLPARGATSIRGAAYSPSPISIHAPRTGSDYAPGKKDHMIYKFQSTLPARGATAPGKKDHMIYKFQSTLPARGATPVSPAGRRANDISIHAPRTGSDRALSSWPPPGSHFNPRSPHGERPDPSAGHHPQVRDFNPRSPHGERQFLVHHSAEIVLISIHAPRTGSDDGRTAERTGVRFQSTLPARGATRLSAKCRAVRKISIHAPRTGSDDKYNTKNA